MDELVDINDVEIEASEFYRDIRPYTTPDVGQIWQISSYINNMNPEDDIEISWNHYDAISIGEDYDVYFILNGEVFDMKQTSSIILNNISDSQIIVQIGGSPLSSDYIGVPTKFNVSTAYPNPFNPVTNVDFAIPKAGNVSIKVYNLVGQVMETLVDDYKSAGFHTRSATLSLALREREFFCISDSLGSKALRVNTFSVGTVLHIHIGYSRGQIHDLALLVKNCFTILSSNE